MNKTTLTGLAIWLATSSTAFAASGRHDNSGVFAWVFLGFCGMIVAAQLLPAVLMMFGIVKSFKPAEKKAISTSH